MLLLHLLKVHMNEYIVALHYSLNILMVFHDYK